MNETLGHDCFIKPVRLVVGYFDLCQLYNEASVKTICYCKTT